MELYLHSPSVPPRHVAGRPLPFIKKPESEKIYNSVQAKCNDKILYKQTASGISVRWKRTEMPLAVSQEEQRLLWCETVPMGDQLLTFRRIVVPPSSRLRSLLWLLYPEAEDTKFPPKTPEATQPMERHHVPAYANIRQHRCGNRIYRKVWQAEVVTKVTTRSHVRTHLTLPSTLFSDSPYFRSFQRQLTNQVKNCHLIYGLHLRVTNDFKFPKQNDEMYQICRKITT